MFGAEEIDKPAAAATDGRGKEQKEDEKPKEEGTSMEHIQPSQVGQEMMDGHRRPITDLSDLTPAFGYRAN